jgi:Na+/H+ antiporter NhaD/arsenite permease-like protein
VALTYLAITTSYVPLMIKELRAQQTKTDEAKTSPAPQTRPKVTIVGYTVAVAVVVALSIASPFFGLASGVSGIINVVIIFVGLAQAWKQTRRDERLLMGPYELTEGHALG